MEDEAEAAPGANRLEAALGSDWQAGGPRGDRDTGRPGGDQVGGDPEGDRDAGGPGGEQVGGVPGVHRDSRGPGNDQVGDGVPAGYGGDGVPVIAISPRDDEVRDGHGEEVLLLQLEVVLLQQDVL